MKKVSLLLTVLLIVVMAVPALTSSAQDEGISIAVVMPSTINDLAFSQSMYDALIAIMDEYEEVDEVAYSENMFVVEDAATALRDYADEGYDLVIAHGSQYGSSLAEIAPDYPDTAFAWGTTVDTFEEEGISNVYAYEARSEEGGFVMGVMAALMTESNVIGIVGPIETGDAKLYVDGFTTGVMWGTEDEDEYTVLVNYIQSFSDVSLAAAAAEAMLDEGADILTGTAQMVPGAVNKANEAGALWFGTQSNQTALAPDIVVASQVYDWTVALEPIVDDVIAGEIAGISYALTLENDGLVIEYNPDFELDSMVEEAGQSVFDAIVEGSISFEIDEDGNLVVVEPEE
jgi:basic membrane protein A